MRRRIPASWSTLLLAAIAPRWPRLISLIERGGEPAARSAGSPTRRAASAYTVGITGAPGAGKSTLTDRLIRRSAAGDTEVGVLAIDPTSPFTGGAILGDRVRMQDHAIDAGVFIRSMATRGHMGGLALATPEAIRVLDAAGFPIVLVETVGVGQVEVEIAGEADTTVVVVTPGWGDSVQANKAGLLEMADVFVDQQGRPRRRRRHRARPRADARPVGAERLASAGDRGRRPPPATASTSSGTRSPTTVSSSRRTAGLSGAEPSASSTSCTTIVRTPRRSSARAASGDREFRAIA